LSQDFQPSKKSLSPKEVAEARLRYICKAAEVVQAQLEGGDSVPHWVLDRINQAAQSMGMAVSYVSYSKEKEAKPKKKAKARRPRKKG
jgi:hypothetical protein